MVRVLCIGVAFMLVVPIVVGCGPKGRPAVKTVKVSGAAMLDGKPLDGAKVNFVGPDFAGIATTDSSGRFELDAQPGENTVFIQKVEGASSDPRLAEFQSDGPGGKDAPKELVPAKYSDPSKTELKFTVPDGGATDANFDMSSN